MESNRRVPRGTVDAGLAPAPDCQGQRLLENLKNIPAVLLSAGGVQNGSDGVCVRPLLPNYFSDVFFRHTELYDTRVSPLGLLDLDCVRVIHKRFGNHLNEFFHYRRLLLRLNSALTNANS